jgi:hypothetical protein
VRTPEIPEYPTSDDEDEDDDEDLPEYPSDSDAVDAYDNDFDKEPMPTTVEGLTQRVHVLEDRLVFLHYGSAALTEKLVEANCGGGTNRPVCMCQGCFLAKRFAGHTSIEDMNRWPFHWTGPPQPCILKRCFIDTCARLGLTCMEIDEDDESAEIGPIVEAEKNTHILLVTDEGAWDVWYGDLIPMNRKGIARHEMRDKLRDLFAAIEITSRFFQHSDGTDYFKQAQARDGRDFFYAVPCLDECRTETDSNDSHEY